MMGGEFDRQIELRRLIPKPLHPLPLLHGHSQIQYGLATLGSRIVRLGKQLVAKRLQGVLNGRGHAAFEHSRLEQNLTEQTHQVVRQHHCV